MSGNIDIESLKKYLLNIQKSTIFDQGKQKYNGQG